MGSSVVLMAPLLMRACARSPREDEGVVGGCTEEVEDAEREVEGGRVADG